MTSATRRAVVAAAGATALTSVTGMDVRAAGEKPNIIFILADDLGYADLSCFGQTDYQTPVLDRLAKDGMRLTDCYANSAVCSATRTALVTGRYQFRVPIGLREPAGGADLYLPPEHPTIASLLRGLGYRTSLIGKWHLGNYPDHGPRKVGYDYSIGFNGGASDYFNHTLWENDVQVEKTGYLTDILTEKAIAELRTAKASGKPFFMSLHYNAPHWPWEGPGDLEVSKALVPAGGRGGAGGAGGADGADGVGGRGAGGRGAGAGGRGAGAAGVVGADGAAAPSVAGPAGAVGAGGAGRGAGGAGAGGAGRGAGAAGGAGRGAGGGGAGGGSGGLRHNDGGSLKKYGEMVGYMDAAIGKVLAALRAQGQERDTIVVFTSDNGGERFSKVWPFTGMKGELLEGGIRVPGIVRWPAGIPGGGTSGQMTTSMDWLPTLVAAAGGSPDRAYPSDGENLLPVLTGKAPAHSRKLFWRYKAENQAAVRDGNMKYLKIGTKEYLFDLVADQHERANIRGKNTALFDRLKQDYEAWNKGMLPYPENMGSENAKSVGNIPDRY